MAKAGRLYEILVSDVLHSMSPGAVVNYGKWIVGPDGKRDSDVTIRGIIDGEEQFVYIECKDWNTPVGVEIIDALDSKKRDVGADYSLICSNSGFTKTAIHKGSRVGIGLISILKKDDPAIKVIVNEEILSLVIYPEENQQVWHFPPTETNTDITPNLSQEKIKYNGLPVLNWTSNVLIVLPQMYPDASTFEANYTFKKPIIIDFDGLDKYTIGLSINLNIKTNWASQTVTIDSNKAIHDFLRHRTIIPPGPNQQIIINGLDPNQWKPTDYIPEASTLGPNESRIRFSLMKNTMPPPSSEYIPNIDDLISHTEIKIDGKIIENKSVETNSQIKQMSGLENLVTPIQAEPIKLGRNEPCWCGSGKKYKKCHLP